MRSKIYRYAGAIGAVAGFGTTVFAQADADAMIGTLSFTSLMANTGSVIGQAWPVAALAASIPLALGFLAWTIAVVSKAIRGGKATK